jgi:hypothetical protein
MVLLAAAPLSAEVVSRDIVWSMDVTTAAATITGPAGPGPYPGVVIVPGSGPTDRNWCSPLLPGANCSGALLAAELAKAGFVVIRYDKRFTGPYAAGNLPLLRGKLSMQSHMDEIAGAAAQLKKEPAVDRSRVFALTSSEGALHALNCQLAGAPAFAGLVLTGAPGRSMQAVLRSQIAAKVAASPDAADIMARYDKLMAKFMAGLPFAPDPALHASINQLVAQFYNPAGLPFARELLSADVAALAARARGPMLVLIGKKDIQVDWQQDGRPLEKALSGNKDAAFSYPENANHILKYELKPREQLTGQDGLYYNAADRIIDPDAVKEIIGWLKARAYPKPEE